MNKWWLFPIIFLLLASSVSAAGTSTNEVYLFSIIFIIITILIIIGYEAKSLTPHIIAGMIFIVTGTYIITQEGLPGYSNIFIVASTNGWLYLSSWILVSFGLFFFLMVLFQNIIVIKEEDEWL